jgi:hypothetical protein
VNNLKQIGLSVRQWAMDHGDRYPWYVTAAQGGVSQTIQNTANPPQPIPANIHAGFAVLSNEVNTPKVLYCPSDGGGPGNLSKEEKSAFGFYNFNAGGGIASIVNPAGVALADVYRDNSGCSYFIGTSSQEEQPQRFLAGDRNINATAAGTMIAPGVVPGLQMSANNSVYGWTSDMHQDNGNVGLADGSVQQLSDSALREAAKSAQDSYGVNGAWFLGLPNQ